MSNDKVILKTKCSNCKEYNLVADLNPAGPYDEDGHTDETEVSGIRCPVCGPAQVQDEEYERALNVYLEHTNLIQVGTIYQEID